jgi:tRNA(fMet)-specific endonuclease VapC
MLDTNICIRVLRHRPASVRGRFNEEAGTLAISTITLMELLRGAAKSARPLANRTEVQSLAAHLAVLDFDQRAAAHAGDIHADLQRKGTLIGPYDILIAGHARSRGLVVITGNLGDFCRVDGLRCEDWLAGSHG